MQVLLEAEPPLRANAPLRSRQARLGKALAGARAAILAPLFVVGIGLAIFDPALPGLPWRLASGALLIGAYALRIWATGYRTWVRGSGGTRHLMRSGPYAHVRHPIYLANGIAGAASFAVLGRWELLAVYSPLYLVLIACVVAREEEALAERYGQDHAAYRGRVPAFLPLPRRSLREGERHGSFSWRPIRTGLEVWKLLGIAGVLAFFLVR